MTNGDIRICTVGLFFFFQAEDGIRDRNVTGVQTCALPILKYLDTTWKAEQEAAKRAGNITSYRVITVEARGENDADIYLVTNYKNWAAFDGATAKGDAIAKQVEGTLAASNQGAVDRAKIRRVLGSWTGQELDLK